MNRGRLRAYRRVPRGRRRRLSDCSARTRETGAGKPLGGWAASRPACGPRGGKNGGGRLGRASRRAGPQAGQPAQERGRERGGKGARLGRAQEKRPKKKEKRVFLFILFPILAIIHR
jgi:hypothetical protein